MLPTLMGIAVLISIWAPVFKHFHVRVAAPDDYALLAMRRQPNDRVFALEPLKSPLLPIPPLDRLTLMAAAEKLLQSGAFDHETGVGELGYASFEAPDVLVGAYNATGDTVYLARAAEFISTFSAYERTRWRDHGFLWNDHAIAERVGAVARFWVAYRKSDLFDLEVAREILWHSRRCVGFLLGSEHFTVATNHGVMQNLALLQAAAAFPPLFDATELVDLAIARLNEQYAFFFSSEGVVLEHSAGYHKAGLYMLEHILELVRLHDREPPAQWVELLARGIEFELRLERPDGTLPAIGDTRYDLSAALRDTPHGPTCESGPHVYPISGYALWCSTDPATGTVRSHNALTWAFHRGLGHKLADEMSLLIWSGGRTWITNTGYWPYGDPNRRAAEGWLSGNAPHWTDEPRDSDRRTNLNRYAATAGIVAIELVRRLGDGAETFSRHVIDTGAGVWLVADAANAIRSRTAEMLWTFAPDLGLVEAGTNSYRVSDRMGNAFAAMLAGGPGLDVKVIRGSLEPLAGWVADGAVRPAPALLVRNADAQGYVFSLFATDGRAATEVDQSFESPSKWRFRATVGGAGLSVERSNEVLDVVLSGQAHRLELQPGSDVSEERAFIESTVAAAAARYPRYRDLDFYRMRLSLLVVFGLIVQEPALYVLKWFKVRDAVRALLRWITVAAWIALGAWAHFIYLT